MLSGAVVRSDGQGGPGVGVAGVQILATSFTTQVEAVTGADGRFRFDDLPAGTYLVLARVPARYAPRTGLDPWLGGPTWTAVLGVVVVGARPIDLVDLQLVDR